MGVDEQEGVKRIWNSGAHPEPESGLSKACPGYEFRRRAGGRSRGQIVGRVGSALRQRRIAE